MSKILLINGPNLDLLGKQLAASFMIKHNYKIINFNNKYDLICIKNKIFIIADIQILLNHKSINGKSQSNKLNFDMNMKNFLSTLEIDLNQIRLDKIIVNLIKPFPQINLIKGVKYDIN